MTVTTPTIYNIAKSIEGNLLGLDSSTLQTPKGDYAPYLMGRDFQGLRLFPIGKSGLQGSDYKIGCIFRHNDLVDDFMGATVSTFWNSIHGSDGSSASAINVQNGGIYRLTSGAGSTHTMAVNGAQITSAKVLKPNSAGLRFETRLGNISAITGQSICFGLIDTSTLNAPFTRATTTTTANATNGAAFLQDSASTNTNLFAVAVNAGGSAQSVALGVSVDTAALHVYRIEINAAGDAMFYIDSVLVATILLAVAPTAALCTSVGMFSNVTSGSQTLDIDYKLAQQVRV